MATLTIGGTAVPLQSLALDAPLDTGMRCRAWDGRLRSVVGVQRRRWRAETAPLELAQADAVAALLAPGTAVTAADVLGTYDVVAELGERRREDRGSGFREVLSFRLLETS
jgi:hypothetical protein